MDARTELACPILLKKLQGNLVSDGIITSKEEVVVIRVLEDDLTINDESMDKKLSLKYRRILSEHGIDSDTDGIRIITPVTIISGSMAKNYHQFNFSDENYSYDYHQYDDMEEDYDDDFEEYLTDELYNTKGLHSYERLLKHKMSSITSAHKTYDGSNWQLLQFSEALLKTLKGEDIIDEDKFFHLALHDGYIAANGQKIEVTNTQNTTK